MVLHSVSVDFALFSTLIVLFCCGAHWIPKSAAAGYHFDVFARHPCTHGKSKHPFIRVRDETGQSPDIVLGNFGLRYYMVSPKTPGDIVIECSSRYGLVEWVYDGRGATSGFKVIRTRWATSDTARTAQCFSSALVISNVTDQLTGKYTCRNIDSPQRENEFRLFVPQTAPHFHMPGEEINITVSDWTESMFDSIILPCTNMDKPHALVSLYKKVNGGFIKQETGPGLTFDPYIGFQLTPMNKDAGVAERVGYYECRIEPEQTVLLRVNLLMQPDEKVAPETPQVRASAPYISWTTRLQPKIVLDPETPNYVLWQRSFTKRDFEEDSNSAPVFHLGSFHALNETEGFRGRMTLLGLSTNGSSSIIRQWNYTILSETSEQEPGIKYVRDREMHFFTCTSINDVRPKISLVELNSTGHPINSEFDITDVQIKDCLGGCVVLSTEIPHGIVTCVGDGVDERFHYPPPDLETSRPFFVERGHTVFVPGDDVIVTLPCLVNNPQAESEVYLFKTSPEGVQKLWSPGEDRYDMIAFYPTWGFHLDTSFSQFQDPSGTYFCSSSGDFNDKTDMVTVIVTPPPAVRVRLHPKDKNVYGHLPFIFKWESEDELTIAESGVGEILSDFAVEASEYTYSGNVTISNLQEGHAKKLTLIRVRDGKIVHSWTFHSANVTDMNDHRIGLQLERKEDLNGLVCNVITCRSQSQEKPTIEYYYCDSPNACALMHNCHERNCNPEPNECSTAITPEHLSSCTHGCSVIAIKCPSSGMFNVSCVGDGVQSSELFVGEEFLHKGHSSFYAPSDPYIIHLHVSLPASSDQDPRKEVQNIASNLLFEIGDTLVLSCSASSYIYTNGIKWAVEMKDGMFVYHNDSIYDPQFKYSGTAQTVMSTMNLFLDSLDIKRVWCFVPDQYSTNGWRNASTPIFIQSGVIRSEFPVFINSPAALVKVDLCQDTESSIRLINVFPPPSELNYEFNDTRLDDKDYFVVPEGVTQLAVEMVAAAPVEWMFSGFGAGPSLTPLIQQERHILEFNDTSTYCYSGKLLLNLRGKSGNDTGRYVAKYKMQPGKFATFYLFVPSKPYILRSGIEVNETWRDSDEYITRPFLPCLLSDPTKKVRLFKQVDTVDSQGSTFMPVETGEDLTYDPRTGFTIHRNERRRDIIGTYKCIADEDPSDFLIVNVQPPTNKPSGVKHEKVGDFNVFTCRSTSDSKPTLKFIEFSSDGMPMEATSQTMVKDCPGGCTILMTTAKQGSISCTGDGVDETIKFPSALNGPGRNVDRKTGLWFDKDARAFRCQTNSPVPPKLAAVTCRRPNECSIMQSLLHVDGDLSQSTISTCGEGCSQLTIQNRAKPNWPANWFSAFLRCHGEDMEIFSQYFFEKNETIVPNPSNVEPFRKVRLDIVTIRKQGNMIQATFRCFANRYFYSRGFQWALESNNGTHQIQETIDREVEVQNFASIMSETMLEFDESEYKAVWCFAPVLDSHHWVNASVTTPINNLIFAL